MTWLTPNQVKDALGFASVESVYALIRTGKLAAENHNARGDNGRARWGHATHSINEPLPTVTASKDFALVSPLLMRTSSKGWDKDCAGVKSVAEPVQTIIPKDGLCLASATLIGAGGPGYSGKPTPVDAPIGTVMVENHRALVSAFLAKHYGGVVGHAVDRPIGTVTAVDHHSAVAANLVHFNHGDKQWNSPEEPARTLTTGNHAALVYSFLVKYFGTAIGSPVTEPLHTATAKHRFGLVTVMVDGEPYVIADIGLRMLTPRELARAQGFPDSYLLTGTKSNQVARIGNSVCPVMAEALARANVGGTQ